MQAHLDRTSLFGGFLLLLASMVFMGFILHSSLGLGLRVISDQGRDLHMDALAWEARLLMDHGLEFAAIAPGLARQSLDLEPDLQRVAAMDPEGRLVIARMRPRSLVAGSGMQAGSRFIGTIDSRAGSFAWEFRPRSDGGVPDEWMEHMIVKAVAVLLFAGLAFLWAPLLRAMGRNGRFRFLDVRRLLMAWTPRRGIVLLASALLAFGIASVAEYQDVMDRAHGELARGQARVVRSVLATLSRAEPRPEEWSGAGELVGALLGAQGSGHLIRLVDSGGTVLWEAGPHRTISGAAARGLGGRDAGDAVESLGLPDGRGLSIQVFRDPAQVDQVGLSVIIDLLSLLVVVVMFTFEGARALAGGVGSLSAVGPSSRKIRFIVFLLFTALFMPSANLVRSLASLANGPEAGTPDMVSLTITVSAWLFGVAIMSLLARTLVRRLGFERLLGGLLALLAVSFVFDILLARIGTVLFLRLVSGLVHGALVILYGNARGTGMRLQPAGWSRLLDRGEWNAAFASGIIVGMGGGGLLGAWFGPRPVSMLALAIVVILLVHQMGARPYRGFVPVLAGLSLDFLRRMGPRRTGSFLRSVFLVFLPLQLSTQGMFFFLFPLYLASNGISQADLARVLSAYGIIGLLSPLWKRMVMGYRQERMFIIASHMICGTGVLYLALMQDLASMVLAALSMGVAAMLDDGVSYRLVPWRPDGLGRAVETDQWIRLAGLLGAVLVPLGTAVLALCLGIREAIFIIGVLSLAGTVTFSVHAGLERKGVPGP